MCVVHRVPGPALRRLQFGARRSSAVASTVDASLASVLAAPTPETSRATHASVLVGRTDGEMRLIVEDGSLGRRMTSWGAARPT